MPLARADRGGYTTYLPIGELASIFKSSQQYQAAATGLIILAGKEYGMGSSRDWAAKGVKILGIRAVIAESYERIHRSNLAMMGLVPLNYLDGQNAETLGLDGSESFYIQLPNQPQPRQRVRVRTSRSDGG
ncbi:hypothetical protein CRD60_01530 [Bifidobacterium aemilianum]|uniref:Aconitase A/isopropylmalate dehydratase small subunit swivel domain-containing protein n=1 Tax=Bifidobacterium aemilianum TaxID=2493120 RepID=A0A366KBJ3_9BIFI|nr:hypothetical protein [Bifidobacterium aemilianum]RBP98558.1 hypothetical protein CRD60_01530 [Bifidobacterium aemilianum]